MNASALTLASGLALAAVGAAELLAEPLAGVPHSFLGLGMLSFPAAWCCFAVGAAFVLRFPKAGKVVRRRAVLTLAAFALSLSGMMLLGTLLRLEAAATGRSPILVVPVEAG
ncbi:MAG TPA: hypothetical protein VIM58_07715, partial [Candidatus Methylacidiphilales bacterium]